MPKLELVLRRAVAIGSRLTGTSVTGARGGVRRSDSSSQVAIPYAMNIVSRPRSSNASFAFARIARARFSNGWRGTAAVNIDDSRTAWPSST